MNYIDLGDETKEEQEKDLVAITQEEKEENKKQEELEFNKINRETSEKLMEEASTNRDGYWDSNNIFVKILLLGLGIIIILGVIYYVFMYMGQ